MKHTPYPQDLHIHTVYSKYDSSVVPAQRLELVARVKHAEIIGISDHFEHFADNEYDRYVQDVRAHGFLVGTEIDGAQSVDFAASLTFDYYIYHCRDRVDDYCGAERLLATGRPVIIAHPNALDTDLNRIPPECLVEINNRYVWHVDWASFYGPHKERFGFVISSDAHQPQWLGQSVARRAAMELGVEERLLTQEKGAATHSSL
jgi:histidinol phosphatase-like PHP family hydrolase